MEKIMCPLLAMRNTGHPLKDNTSDCVEVRCAWWDSVKERCAIKMIAHKLADIESALVTANSNFRD